MIYRLYIIVAKYITYFNNIKVLHAHNTYRFIFINDQIKIREIQ